MKKSELRQMIKEELQKLKEGQHELVPIKQLNFEDHNEDGELKLPSLVNVGASIVFNKGTGPKRVEEWKRDFIKQFGSKGVVDIDAHKVSGNPMYDRWFMAKQRSAWEWMNQYNKFD